MVTYLLHRLLVAGPLPPDLTVLHQEAASFKSAAYAESTKKTYSSMRTAYLRFCLHYGLTPVPATQSTVILYAVFLARTLNPRSIPAYLNIIRLLHLSVGLPNPLKDWELDLIKRGISRQLGSPPKQKLPITPDILLRIKAHLTLSEARDCAFWCACLIAFYTFLRKSSLLPRSAKQADKSGLCHGDLRVEPPTNFMYITVRHTKTIQFHQRTLCIPIAGLHDSALCPLEATLAMLANLPAGQTASDAPLFSYVSQGALTCIDYSAFVQRLKVVLNKAELPSDQYSGHSFRRGGCTFAFELGVPPLLIKLRGDWRSNAYERYVSVPDSMNAKVARAISLAASAV